ncbi:MAG: hypothetical protein H5T86_04490 [Armatimonadetes bacterium]|nr:hypothetical protein [Armatimonadota bacterium]
MSLAASDAGMGFCAMKTTVSAGDVYKIGGQTMTVVEVRRWTDENGVVAFEQAPVIARLYRLAGDPLVVGFDEHFACFLLQAPDGRSFSVGVYHPGLGERIQPAVPRVPPFMEDFVMCWAPGRVRVLIDGQPAENKAVSIVLESRTAEGAAMCLLPDKYKLLMWSDEWQALVDSGQRDGCYKTDASGYVYNAALGEPLMFPRGHGAWGQRHDDRLHDGSPPPAEYVERVWLYFRGQRVELREGEDATLDWRTGTLVVTGPSHAWVSATLEHVGNDPTSVTCRVTQQIPPSGQLTIQGLYPGRYCLSAWLPGSGTDERDWSRIARRQWVEVAPGQTATVEVQFQEPPPGYRLIYVYTSGADSEAGIKVWGLLFSGYEVLGQTDQSGAVLVPSFPPPMDLLVNDPYWGYQQIRGDGPTYEATLAGYVVLGLGLGFGGEGGWWAFPGEAHEHLDGLVPDWGVKVVQTGETIPVLAVPIGARTEVPVPHLPPGEIDGWNFIPPEATYDIVLVDPDGKTVCVLQEAGEVARDGTDWSLLVLRPLGGKAWGDLLQHKPDQSTDPALPEAARIGLEHGEWLPAVWFRAWRQDAGGRQAWLGWVCPYCLCMTWVWPGTGYGYCPQCGTDARTYMHGPPLTEGTWNIKFVVCGPNRARHEIACSHWYRPLEYAENDDFLAVYRGLPRWVCRHPVLGEWNSGVWLPGTDVEELEAEWCNEDHRLLVRPKLQIAGQIAGDAVYRLRYRTDGGTLKHLDFRLENGGQGIKLLNLAAPVVAETRGPEAALFVREVTSVSLLEPEVDPGNHFYVVGDVPSLIVQPLRIKLAEASHFALQLGLVRAVSGPDLCRTPDGRLFIAYVQDGDIWVAQRPSPQAPWSTPVRITAGGCYADPSIAALPTGALVVAYTDLSAGQQRLAISVDDGATWA